MRTRQAIFAKPEFSVRLHCVLRAGVNGPKLFSLVIGNPFVVLDGSFRAKAGMVLYGPKTYATPLAGAPAAKTEPLIATGQPYSPPVTVAAEVASILFQPVAGSV
jgi:hypothetical protein